MLAQALIRVKLFSFTLLAVLFKPRSVFPSHLVFFFSGLSFRGSSFALLGTPNMPRETVTSVPEDDGRAMAKEVNGVHATAVHRVMLG